MIGLEQGKGGATAGAHAGRGPLHDPSVSSAAEKSGAIRRARVVLPRPEQEGEAGSNLLFPLRSAQSKSRPEKTALSPTCPQRPKSCSNVTDRVWVVAKASLTDVQCSVCADPLCTCPLHMQQSRWGTVPRVASPCSCASSSSGR